MRRILGLLGAVLLSAGCPSDCRKACENVNQICAAEFQAQGETFDVDHCTSSCDQNLDGCKNMDEQASCVSEKTACAQLQTCPACLQ